MFKVKKWITDNYGPCLAAEYEWETARADDEFRERCPSKTDPTLDQAFFWASSVRGFDFWKRISQEFWDDYCRKNILV